MPTPERIQRTYYLLVLGNTLATSFIWGINTIFLLDAGLSNLEAFAANAFFTAGMVIFEVPTGIVADSVGRRASFLLGTVTLAVTTLLYVYLWQIEGPFWAWAGVSILLGLGFTFFSGALEAWLVDALTATGYTGDLETVLGRGQVVTGIAMLSGSVAGGYLAQLINLGAPFVLRGIVLAVMFVVAFRVMHDVGFEPRRGEGLSTEMRRIGRESVRYGLGVAPVRWLMLSSPFLGGIGIYAFYALQPYLLELVGDPEAYGIAGLTAAIVAGAQIVGGITAPRIRRLFHRRTSALLASTVVSVAALAVMGAFEHFWVVIGAVVVWGLLVRRRPPDPPGLPERPHTLATARDDHLLRLADGLGRRRRRPAGLRPRRRRIQLRDHLPVQRRRHGAGAAVPLPLAARERAGRHRDRARRRAGAGRGGRRARLGRPQATGSSTMTGIVRPCSLARS